MKKLPGRPCRERKFMVISLSLPDSSRMPYRERMRLSPIIIIMRCFRSVAELMAAFETSLAPVSLSPIVMKAVALGVDQNQITTFLLPVQASNHPIYNPSLDYSVYLSQPFFFVLFQILILLTTVYAVGIEIKFRTADEWLSVAKGNMVTAVLGKLLPYTIIYILIGWLANYVMFGILHIPFQGSWGLMSMLTALFVVATQALGLFLFSLFPAISLIISIVSMVGSLGATLSGVTFPVPNMYPLVRDASYLFPVRHFTEIIQNILYGGSGFIHLWPSAVILCIFPLLAFAATSPFETSHRKS